jgi:two-component system, OmpR family, sensor histidine kinase QseC
VLFWSSPQVHQTWQAADLPRQPLATHGRALVDGVAMRMRTIQIGRPDGPMWLEVGLSERFIALVHSGTAMRLGGTILGMVALSITLLGLVQFLVLRGLM